MAVLCASSDLDDSTDFGVDGMETDAVVACLVVVNTGFEAAGTRLAVAGFADADLSPETALTVGETAFVFGLLAACAGLGGTVSILATDDRLVAVAALVLFADGAAFGVSFTADFLLLNSAFGLGLAANFGLEAIVCFTCFDGFTLALTVAGFGLEVAFCGIGFGFTDPEVDEAACNACTGAIGRSKAERAIICMIFKWLTIAYPATRNAAAWNSSGWEIGFIASLSCEKGEASN
ncbi:hypothetical protein [Ruegeria arenilitoris]|uniref:hypothetical protein n=1 Tax=Ruegeria arenilitoris TaxID=1173585 RepID=UPI00147CEEC8|nr:hypothetical protein [Ruegeria arenilitoris]